MLREMVVAHLCGIVMGMATIMAMVPGAVQMMRILNP
jgi:hypothetical protein